MNTFTSIIIVVYYGWGCFMAGGMVQEMREDSFLRRALTIVFATLFGPLIWIGIMIGDVWKLMCKWKYILWVNNTIETWWSLRKGRLRDKESAKDVCLLFLKHNYKQKDGKRQFVETIFWNQLRMCVKYHDLDLSALKIEVIESFEEKQRGDHY